MIAVNIKMIVATTDRLDKRETPQIPWPLVQPPPIRVPIPTRSPETIVNGSESEKEYVFKNSGNRFKTSNAPNKNPKIKNHLQRCAGFVIRFEKMPLRPQILPCVIMSNEVERPIRRPPMRESE